MLDRENVMRAQTESYKLEAIEKVEALQKTIEGCRRRSPPRTGTSYCKRKSLSLHFRSKGRRIFYFF